MTILNAGYIACMTEQGRTVAQPFQLTAQAGESVFIHTSGSQCALHWEILSGLRPPRQGRVSILDTDLYALSEKERAAFRRDRIGAVPFGGGLIPELRSLEQILLPLKLAGMPQAQLLREAEKRTSPLLPMHSLYSPPPSLNPRKQIHAAILRAAITDPPILILDRTLEGFHDIDQDILWQALTDLRTKNSVLLYFSRDPAPPQIPWTQSLLL